MAGAGAFTFESVMLATFLLIAAVAVIGGLSFFWRIGRQLGWF